MAKKPNAGDFLARLEPVAEPAKPRRAARAAPPPAKAGRPPKPASEYPSQAARSQLKHFGGYVDDGTLEKIALLRIRLKKDNSELIAHAIAELHRQHTAKRVFGDD